MSPTKNPKRGEVWLAELDPTRGREQQGARPCLVVSADEINESRAGLVTIIPFTTTRRGIPSHVDVDAPEGGLDRPSAAMCEQIRTITKSRLVGSFGRLTEGTMAEVDEKVRFVLGL